MADRAAAGGDLRAHRLDVGGGARLDVNLDLAAGVGPHETEVRQAPQAGIGALAQDAQVEARIDLLLRRALRHLDPLEHLHLLDGAGGDLLRSLRGPQPTGEAQQDDGEGDDPQGEASRAAGLRQHSL